MDLLRLPVIGSLLRWRHIRQAMQLVALAVAAAVVLHGLLGPQIAPRNLATVLTSIHWRGLLILAIVLAGNLACGACPMILSRDAARRMIAPRFTYPRWLRGKWVGVALLVGVLFSYELFDLWSWPAATAWLVLGYFVLALAIDLAFKGASFCKHVCPIGQFNYVASTMAPMELRARDAETCRTCRTFDCIKGRPARPALAAPLRFAQRGCELGLFMPAKAGNLDCTFCLDCVHACPHDNVALATRVPGAELLDTRRRSGVGRLTRRPDIAALAIVFTFAALLIAFGMTAPAYALEGRLGRLLQVRSEAAVLALVFVLAIGVAPATLMAAAAIATRAAAARPTPLLAVAQGYAPVFIPLGVGVWLAHYGFHLFTGVLTVFPATQSAAFDLAGWPLLGDPLWRWAGMPPGAVYPMQFGVIMLGALGSIALVQATSRRDHPERPVLTSLPWIVIVVALAAVALWILQQPMEMRGLGGLE
jgi:polyferredoxin